MTVSAGEQGYQPLPAAAHRRKPRADWLSENQTADPTWSNVLFAVFYAPATIGIGTAMIKDSERGIANFVGRVPADRDSTTLWSINYTLYVMRLLFSVLMWAVVILAFLLPIMAFTVPVDFVLVFCKLLLLVGIVCVDFVVAACTCRAPGADVATAYMALAVEPYLQRDTPMQVV